ncbi:hypothetical protein FANTH_9115 [Fusarium anthophilum]|uniref:Uncharacterized protein n=1 Tax=Fusarium anthophilum TaxID=48485 RepID=A0A8H5DZJ6_9HYPO|nr:hypothetical protein FANTH_9115 [Fusarium anthophilum]
MPGDEITEKHLSVSVDGHCEYIARAALRLDRRVSQSIPPWHPENREIDVLSLASSNNIGWKMKTVKGDAIPKLRRIPDSCIKWVEPEHLEAAKQEYNKQENHEQDHLAPIDQWPEDPIQSIIHAHMHGYHIVCEPIANLRRQTKAGGGKKRGRDPEDDFFHPELYSSLTTTIGKTAFDAFSKMDLRENGSEIEDPAINRLWRSHENGKTFSREQRIGRVARLQGFRYNVQVELSPSFVHPRSTWEILQSNLTGLGKNLNKPIQIAVYAFYMAQVKLFDHELNDLVLNGIITAEERHQIETSSLDSAQGNEAHVVFIDYGLVSDIGLQQRAIGQSLHSLTRVFTPSAS